MNNAEAINLFLSKVREDIIADQQAKNLRSSGDSATSLRPVVEENRGMLMGADYIKYQVTGRGPGKFPPLENIEAWIMQKNLKLDIPERSLAFLIGRKIATYGTDIYQKKREGLALKEITAKNLPELLRNIAKTSAARVATAIREGARNVAIIGLIALCSCSMIVTPMGTRVQEQKTEEEIKKDKRAGGIAVLVFTCWFLAWQTYGE